MQVFEIAYLSHNNRWNGCICRTWATDIVVVAAAAAVVVVFVVVFVVVAVVVIVVVDVVVVISIIIITIVFAGSMPTGMDSGQLAKWVSNASFATLTLIYSFTQMLDLATQFSTLAGVTVRVGQLLQVSHCVCPARAGESLYVLASCCR